MSSIQERLQLKRVPLDTWNIREQLCLASAVVRSGDQNWMSVSRALKTVGDANRPPDWYSQKSCAAQYGALLEHVETPKRKKRSSEGAVETPQESILKRLTQERIVEIQKTVAEMNQQYDLLKTEIAEARNSATSDERLREMWAEIETAKRARERESARRAAALKEREERRARCERTWRPPAHAANNAGAVVSSPTQPSSPLLTSLLKSSPVVTTPQHITHPANVVDTVSPSATAPTLSMLLEKSGTSPHQSPNKAIELTPPHENKHAAIEHIKSQLVQIEQQLKANPRPPLPAAAPLDIDDIEIKAEDVYAFRDIDLHIPPVIHKPNNRTPEKATFKKDEQEIPVPMEEIVTEQIVQDVKEEPVVTENTTEEVVPIDVETIVQEPQPTVERVTSPPAEVTPDPVVTSEVKVTLEEIKFPEVKFPSPEIKIVTDELQIKEEVKETEIPVEPEREQDDDVDVEHIQEDTEPVVLQPEIPPEPAEVMQPVEEQVTPAPEDIPLPENSPIPQDIDTEPPLPPEPEVPQEEKQSEPEPEVSVEEKQPEPEVEVDVEVDIKKEVVDEDSIPLKEMMREEAERRAEAEVKDEQQPETEETHTETDDDTPMELSREEEKDGKKKRDYSRKKKPDSRTCSGSESAAEASAPSSPSPLATDRHRQHRLWKKSVMLVYSRLCAHKYASIFLRPISDDEAPGYSLVVKRPMDLTTIRRNIEAGVISTTAEFQRDVLLMLSNALMYNHSDHSVYHMARDLHEEAVSQLGMLVAAQAHAALVSAPPPTRKRRRHEPAPTAPATAPTAPSAASPSAPSVNTAPMPAKRPH